MAKFRITYQSTKQTKIVTRYVWGMNEKDAMFNLMIKAGKIENVIDVEKVN